MIYVAEPETGKVDRKFIRNSFDMLKWRTNDPILRDLIVDKDDEIGKERKILGTKSYDTSDQFILGVNDIFDGT